MVYETQRQKIFNFLDKQILPALKIKDLDYYKVVSVVVMELGASKKIAEEAINSFISRNLIKEIRILTIPSGEVVNWLKTELGIEKEIKEAAGAPEEKEKEILLENGESKTEEPEESRDY